MKNMIFALALGLFSMNASAGAIESILPTDFDGVNDDSGFILALEYTGIVLVSDASFGFYLTDTGDNTVKDTMTIFGGDAGILSTSSIAWDFANQSATATGGDTLGWAGIEADWRLGAFFDVNGTTIYSHDALNVGGADLVDIFDISAATNGVFDLSFSFNEVAGSFFGHDYYEGMLVKGTDLTAFDGPGVLCENCTASVPEPAGIALMSLGLVGLGLASRRRQVKVANA